MRSHTFPIPLAANTNRLIAGYLVLNTNKSFVETLRIDGFFYL
jgi:hypothetical protein